jgi:putative ABC transport system substrate-binding protein
VGFVTSIGKAYLYPLEDPRSGIVRPFAEGLRDLGYEDGKNLALMRRGSEGVLGRGADIASELIREGVEIIVVTTTTLAKEMMRVTSTVPIVMAASFDPVAAGVVRDLSRPGGNITGFSNHPGPEFEAKRLQILVATAPNRKRIAFLGTKADWENANGRAVREAAPKLGVTVVHAVHTLTNYEDALAFIDKENLEALFVAPQPAPNQKLIVEFAFGRRMPAMYPWRQYVVDGGLMSYGIDLYDQYRRAAGYVDKILKGENPGDLPIQQPTKFELVISLKAAKALGLEIPAPILSLAAEVIE